MELDHLQGHLQSNSSCDSVTLWFYDFAFLLEQFLVFAVERFQKQRKANVRLRGRRKILEQFIGASYVTWMPGGSIDRKLIHLVLIRFIDDFCNY